MDGDKHLALVKALEFHNSGFAMDFVTADTVVETAQTFYRFLVPGYKLGKPEPAFKDK